MKALTIGTAGDLGTLLSKYVKDQTKRVNASCLCALLFILAVLAHAACAVTPQQVQTLKSKAVLAQKELKTAIEQGKDVSRIVPMMKRVKALADMQRFKEADLLLDDILSAFNRLNAPVKPGVNPISGKKGHFHSPRKVNLIGYAGNAMEPFITRDGKYLFFNNHETDNPGMNKDIFYAQRIDAANFKFMGEIKGINTAAVDGVPTMDNHGNFFYVSTAHYDKNNGYTTVYSGKFMDGRITGITPHPELSLRKPGWLNMDIEISADGNTLYSTQTYFGGGPPPKKSYFFVARRNGDRFVTDMRSDEIFSKINTDALEYAASISTDELELFFTRLNDEHGLRFVSYRATRTKKGAPFSAPTPIEAITGFSEAPAVTANGRRLYFHKKEKGHFKIYVLERGTP